MRAITVVPGVKDSARLDEVPEPSPAQGSLLVKALALGVCGTDREIIAGEHGAPPTGPAAADPRPRIARRRRGGAARLRICARRPCGRHRAPAGPGACPACAAGEWDMCRNGRYVEHGIKERDGFGAEYFRIEPEFAVKVDAGLGPLAILLEPTSIVAKAWDHIERVGRRSQSWPPRTVLVTGAGPIGLLAALIGKQRGLDVHVFDRSPEGPKPRLARGARRHLPRRRHRRGRCRRAAGHRGGVHRRRPRSSRALFGRVAAERHRVPRRVSRRAGPWTTRHRARSTAPWF